MAFIETQHKRIPWRWVVSMVLISLTQALAGLAAGNFTFTMRKFIESPALINSFSSLDVLFNLLVAAPCLYISDRIWTRYGRRRIFIIPSWLVMAGCLFLLPMVSSTWALVGLVLLWFIFQDVASTYQLLLMEVVPPEQRPRLMAIDAWIDNLRGIVWAVVFVGRFDEVVNHSEGWSFGGEQAVYWFGGLSMLAGALFVMFFIREVKPALAPGETEPTLKGNGGGFKGVFRELFASRALWPVYLLAFSQVLLGTGLGAISPLLTTEQWGYSKQDLGTNIFVGGVINIFFIPVVGWFAERTTMIRLFTVGVVGGLVLKAVYYVFIQFILPDQRPEIWHMILIGQMMSMFGQCIGIAGLPLIFEYIPRNRMGTAQAGLNFVRSITRLLTLNGIGFWVSGYSKIFCPPGTYDYFSGYLFMLLMSFVGLAILINFTLRVRSGKIVPVGRTEFHPVDS